MGFARSLRDGEPGRPNHGAAVKLPSETSMAQRSWSSAKKPPPRKAKPVGEEAASASSSATPVASAPTAEGAFQPTRLSPFFQLAPAKPLPRDPRHQHRHGSAPAATQWVYPTPPSDKPLTARQKKLKAAAAAGAGGGQGTLVTLPPRGLRPKPPSTASGAVKQAEEKVLQVGYGSLWQRQLAG